MANKFHAEIRLLAPADAAMFRDVRLEALKQDPEAFASTFERENEKPLPWFQERVSQADIFGAFIEDELLGMVGFRAQDRSKTNHKAVLWACTCEQPRETPVLEGA